MTRRYVASLWLLSGLPVGLALILLPSGVRLWCFAAFVLLETGHSLSPIVLAWTHREFRRGIIYANKVKYVAWPAVLFLAACSIGIATQCGLTTYVPSAGTSGQITGLDNPFPLLVWFYSAWNLYHFAMQDYGVWRLCGWKGQRWIFLVTLLSIYLAVGGLNLLGFWRIPGLGQYIWWLGPLVLTGMISVNHWIVDIGLSARATGWWFPFTVLAAGVVGFVWIIPTPNGMMIRIIPAIVSARLGLGFVHFLYSRWIWQHSGKKLLFTCPSIPTQLSQSSLSLSP